MSRSLIVLLPPSEAKRAGGSTTGGAGEFDRALRAERRQVKRALNTFVRASSPTALEAVLNVRGPLLERAVASSKQIASGRAPLLPAWQRYCGVVWTHLEPASLTPEDRLRLWVPSALYGVTSAEEFIAEYRLKMNVRLTPLGNLAAFWRPRLTRVLEQHAPGATLVNLLPREHERAIDLPALGTQREVVTVPFLSGTRAVAGHDAKAVKGVLARHVLREGLDGLHSFEWGHWKAKNIGGITAIVSSK